MNNNNSCGLRANDKFLNFIDVALEQQISTKLKGKFLLVKYEYDKNREEEFLEFILDNLTIYALDKQERDKLATEEIRKLWKTAVHRFVQNSKTGEFGELIIFHLLEVLEKSVQVVNKMSLKTSGKMHYHGADAVHFGSDGQIRTLFIGESKTGENFKDVLRSAFGAINDYYKEEKDEFEINLATGHISDNIPEDLKKEIKDYLDPSKKDKSNFTTTHTIFLGFQNQVLKELEQKYAGKELLEKVIDVYRQDIEKYIKAIEETLNSYEDLKNKRFLFFVIPFKDLNKLKQKFAQEIKNG